MSVLRELEARKKSEALDRVRQFARAEAVGEPCDAEEVLGAIKAADSTAEKFEQLVEAQSRIMAKEAELAKFQDELAAARSDLADIEQRVAEERKASEAAMARVRAQHGSSFDLQNARTDARFRVADAERKATEAEAGLSKLKQSPQS
jgi:hypothetical protein